MSTDNFSVGVAKRLYLIVAVMAFINTLLAVLVSTLAMERLSATELSFASTTDEFFAKLGPL
jgi:hypothetical protein